MNEELLKNHEAQNDAYFKTRINRDFLQTNAAKGVLEKVRKQYQTAEKGIAGRAAITGASDEAVIAQHSANNENLNDAVSNIAQNATNYQENAENQYQQSKGGILNAKMGINSAKAENAANLASNAGNLLGTAAMMSGFGSGTGASAVGRTDYQSGQLNQIAPSGLKSVGKLIIANQRKPLV